MNGPVPTGCFLAVSKVCGSEDGQPAVGQDGGERVVLVLQGHAQGVVIKHVHAVDDVQLAANDRSDSGIEHPLEVGLDVGAGHRAAIVKGHVLADVPGPRQAVFGDLPGMRQSGDDIGVGVHLGDAVVEQRHSVGRRVRGKKGMRVEAADVAPQTDLDRAPMLRRSRLDAGGRQTQGR